mgnify:CR=1 FL=1|tara:strand:- start:452 stop:688 length:237 start_codon:yes stop_codon:yes gene_type:complete
MKILKKNRFTHETIIRLDGYEFVQVFGDDIIVKPISADKGIDEEVSAEVQWLKKDHVQYEVDEQLREDAKIETDDEWR